MRLKMLKIVKPVLLVIMLFWVSISKAQNFKQETLELSGSTIVDSAVEYVVTDPNPDDAQSLTVAPLSYITLKVNPDIAYANAYTTTVNIDVFPLISPGVYDSNATSISLEVSYSPNSNVGNKQNIALKGFEFHGLKAVITGVTTTNDSSSGTISNTPDNVEFYLGFQSDYYRQLSTAQPTFTEVNVINNELVVEWTPDSGAIYYDFEWTWIDNYDKHATKTEFTVKDFEVNNTRIQTKDTIYKIPLVFDLGYIIYRVRPVGVFLTDPGVNTYGLWSSGNPGDSYALAGQWPNKRLVSAHEDNKNWQFQASYAEDGRKKEVVSYFDGTLRNRQTVTKINSDDNAIVGEVIYDNQGRPAVEVLPVPADSLTDGNDLKFYENFNQNLAGNIYTHKDFDWTDLSQNPCEVTTEAMNAAKGASGYYGSTLSRDPNKPYQDYVPNANGYPFSQIQYMPDNTGRIKSKGGVGEQHQINYASGDHEMRYFYTTPEQNELTRLFGNNVGHAAHYKKNIVVDPNNQVSISYIDPQGRTIATALAGEAPTNLTVLDGVPNFAEITTDLLEKADSDAVDTNLDKNIRRSTGSFPGFQDEFLVSKSVISVKENTNFTFDYNLKHVGGLSTYITEVNTIKGHECNTPYPYVYDLSINLKDDCGEEVLSSPISLTVGVPGGEPIPYTAPTLSESLSPGSYQLSKRLNINEDVLNSYLDDFVTSLTTLGSSCYIPAIKPTYEDLGCFTSCDDCISNLDTRDVFVITELQVLYPSATFSSGRGSGNNATGTFEGISVTVNWTGEPSNIEAVKFAIVAKIAEYNLAVEACNAPCNGLNNAVGVGLTFASCDVYDSNLKEDIAPGGQYGQVDSGNANLISVFNEGQNGLIYRFPTGVIETESNNWRHPKGAANAYQDILGNDSFIKLVRTENDLGIIDYTPKIKNDPNVEVFDAQGTLIDLPIAEIDAPEIWIKPQDLEHVEDFVEYLKVNESWLDALIEYHPEYCYLEFTKAICDMGVTNVLDYTKTDGSTVTVDSDGYDAYLRSIETFSQAYNDTDVFKTKFSIYNGTPSGGDPFFLNTISLLPANMQTAISNIIATAVGVTYEQYSDYDMLEAAYASVVCEGNPNCSGASVTPATIASSGLAESQKNRIWNVYKGFYLGLKGRIKATFLNAYAKRNGCYNVCMELEEGETFDLNTVTEEIKYYTDFITDINTYADGGATQYICGANATGFTNKEKRFKPANGNLYSNENNAEDNSGTDYHTYVETGKCPLLFDLEYFLNGIIEEKNTLGIVYNFPSENVVYGGNYATSDLAEAITQGTISTFSDGDIFSGTYIGNATTLVHGSYDIITIDLPTSITTDLGLGWDDYDASSVNPSFWSILGFNNFYYDVNAAANDPVNGQFAFQANITIKQGNITSEHVISGTTPVAIGECTIEGVVFTSNGENPGQTGIGSDLGGPGEFGELYGLAPCVGSGSTVTTETILTGNFDSYTPIDECPHAMPSLGIDEWEPFVGSVDINDPGASNGCLSIQASPQGGNYVSGIGFYNSPLGESFGTTVTGLTIGEDYTVTFYQANPGWLPPTNLGRDADGYFTVIFGEQIIQTSVMPFQGYNNSTWEEVNLTFTATSNVQNLRFVASATNTGRGESYVAIDDIEITRSITTPPIPIDLSACIGCIPQTVAPLNCKEKYEIWFGPLGMDFSTANDIDGDGDVDFVSGLISDYYFTSNYEEDNFCNLNLDQLVDSYLDYINTLNINSVEHPQFLTISEFGDTNLNYGFNNISTVISDFNTYINIPSYNGIIWMDYVDTIWLPLHPNVCPPAPMIPSYDVVIDPNTIENECETFAINVSETYATDIYQNYINQLKEAFKREYINSAMETAIENFTMEYSDKEYQYTLYYYDQAGNLVQTVAPEGVDRVNQEHNFKTQYRYNSLNQLVWQKTPDGGETRFAYDDLGRIIASQNAKQLRVHANVENGNLGRSISYTLYDDLGRITEAGETFYITTISLPGNEVSGKYSIGDDGRLYKNGIKVNSIDTTDPRTEVTKTMYTTPSTLATNLGFIQGNTRNRVTSIVYIEDSTSDLDCNNAIFYDYDIHGNVSKMGYYLYLGDNAQKTLKTTEYEYDLISGNVNRVVYQKGANDQFMHRYSYDADNRITSVETSRNGILWERDASYRYYEHGPLARTVMGDQKVQGLDYAYTIQGWLKGINGENVGQNDIGQDGASTAKDAFAFSLNYFNGDYISVGTTQPFTAAETSSNVNQNNLYNGNIKTMVTSLLDLGGNPLSTLQNNYTYDQLNRIKGMDSYDLASNNLEYQTEYVYDRNGNLKNLKRWSEGVQMDDLNYTYNDVVTDKQLRSNRLFAVTDNPTLDSNFTDIDIDSGQTLGSINATTGNLDGANYKYDEIGQLIQDTQENISNIDWRVDGKVAKIEKVDGTEIAFEYDGLGNRISKTYIPQGNTADITQTYYIRDAQGNTLAVYNKGLVEIHNSTDYYVPSGTIHDTVDTIEAEQNIVLANEGTYTVAPTGDVIIKAGNSILMKPGTRIHTGATVRAYIDTNINIPPVTELVGLKLSEHHIYGSSRLGIQQYTEETAIPGTEIVNLVGDKRYELSNHLGNVLSVISDRKLVDTQNNTIFKPDVLTYNDYYPFGSLLPNRSGSAGSYRYGFQGQEKDDEIKGEGNSLNYKYRMHDPRVGRFFAVDPLAKEYPFFSPYQFAGNSPIANIDREGLENVTYILTLYKDGRSELELYNSEDIRKQVGWTAGNRSNRKPVFAINQETNIYVHLRGEVYTKSRGWVIVSGGKIEKIGAKTNYDIEELHDFLVGNEEQYAEIKKSFKHVGIMQMIQAGSSVISYASQGTKSVRGGNKEKLVKPKSIGARAKKGAKIPLADDVIPLDPKSIELSHPAALGKKFSDSRLGTVSDLAETLKDLKAKSNTEAGKQALDDFVNTIPPIAIAKIKGKTYSANNRRLRAFKEADVAVPARAATKEETSVIKQRVNNMRK